MQQDGTAYDVPVPPQSTYGCWSPELVNDDGAVFGAYAIPVGDGSVRKQVVRYHDGVFEELGEPVDDWVVLKDVNQHGDVVGWVQSPSVATLWTGTERYALDDLLQQDGWVARELWGINDAGLIVGMAEHLGEERQVVFVPIQHETP